MLKSWYKQCWQKKNIAVDDCYPAYSKACLGVPEIYPVLDNRLTDYGVKKLSHLIFDWYEANGIFNKIRESISEMSFIQKETLLNTAH